MPDDASVLFIMLDATRADRLSAWGNPHPTTPTLDGLAAAGALFRRHFANSHATIIALRAGTGPSELAAGQSVTPRGS